MVPLPTAAYQGKQQRAAEEQLQKIYESNDLNAAQQPALKITSDDFRDLQAGLKQNKNETARPDSVPNKILGQIYKDNVRISSRGLNMISLVTPARVQTARQRSPEQALTLEDAASEGSPKHEGEPRDDYDKYRLDRYQRNQRKETQDYVKKVLLEDILYHKNNDQEEKIWLMEKEAEGEDGKMLRRLAKKVAKGQVSPEALLRNGSTLMKNSRSDVLFDSRTSKMANRAPMSDSNNTGLSKSAI